MHAEFTHRDALAALSEQELADLKRQSPRPAAMRLLTIALLLALTSSAVLLSPSWPLFLLAAFIHGTLISYLFMLEHEAIHGTVFSHSWPNTVLAEVTGFLLLLPPRYFRYFHFAHHRHTQDPARDPELSSPRPSGWRAYLWHHTGIPYWRAEIMVLIDNALARKFPSYVPVSGRAKVIWEARAHLCVMTLLIAISLWFRSPLILELWIVPALLGQPMLRAFLHAEHAGCPHEDDMLTNTRTTFTNRIMNFLTWNAAHHTAHHALPVVPFHRLPKLTAIIEERIANKAQSYPDAHAKIRDSWA
jgi:fatty acid desaturase